MDLEKEIYRYARHNTDFGVSYFTINADLAIQIAQKYATEMCKQQIKKCSLAYQVDFDNERAIGAIEGAELVVKLND